MEAKVTQLEVQIQENVSVLWSNPIRLSATLIDDGIFWNQKEIIDRLETKIVQLEAKVQQRDSLLPVVQRQNLTDDVQQQLVSFCDMISSANQSASIMGMPGSCKDLKRIGHTLNGLYSVMGNRSVETVFCDFSSLIDDPG